MSVKVRKNTETNKQKANLYKKIRKDFHSFCRETKKKTLKEQSLMPSLYTR